MPTYRNDETHKVNTPFVYKNRKWLEPGEEAAVDYFLSAPEAAALPLAIVIATPYYALSELTQTNIFVGAGAFTFAGWKDIPIIRVTTTVDISLQANNALNPSTYPLAANDSIDIKNEHTIDDLIVTASAAGTVNVIGLKE